MPHRPAPALQRSCPLARGPAHDDDGPGSTASTRTRACPGLHAVGRDGIITAWDAVMDPSIGAACCATSPPPRRGSRGRNRMPSRQDPARGAQRRDGGLGEVRSGATTARWTHALFVLLAASTTRYRRPSLAGVVGAREAALQWMDGAGDPDATAWWSTSARVRPACSSRAERLGRLVSHADGTRPKAHRAVRGSRLRLAARLAGAAWPRAWTRGPADDLRSARAHAPHLRRAVWCEDPELRLALDGNKRPCQVRSSNAGHVLFAGLCSEERALRTRPPAGRRLVLGLGRAHLDIGERRYTPWPTTTGSYGRTTTRWWPWPSRYASARRRAHPGRALRRQPFFELRRMPELFCGFRRVPARGPPSTGGLLAAGVGRGGRVSFSAGVPRLTSTPRVGRITFCATMAPGLPAEPERRGIARGRRGSRSRRPALRAGRRRARAPRTGAVEVVAVS